VLARPWDKGFEPGARGAHVRDKRWDWLSTIFVWALRIVLFVSVVLIATYNALAAGIAVLVWVAVEFLFKNAPAWLSRAAKSAAGTRFLEFAVQTRTKPSAPGSRRLWIAIALIGIAVVGILAILQPAWTGEPKTFVPKGLAGSALTTLTVTPQTDNLYGGDRFLVVESVASSGTPTSAAGRRWTAISGGAGVLLQQVQVLPGGVAEDSATAVVLAGMIRDRFNEAQGSTQVVREPYLDEENVSWVVAHPNSGIAFDYVAPDGIQFLGATLKPYYGMQRLRQFIVLVAALFVLLVIGELVVLIKKLVDGVLPDSGQSS
jgi:hypothetical protein